MNLNLKNKEFKTVVLGLIVVFFLAVLGLYIIIINQLNIINNRIIEQNAAIISKLTNKYHISEGEMISVITQSGNAADVAKGKKLLMQYGYKEKMPLVFQPVIKDVYRLIGFKIFMVLALIFVPIFIVVWYGHMQIYSKIRAISRVAEKVVDGDFSHSLPEKGEGDFDILGHHFNQMSNRLMLNIDRLKQEKIFLKDIISGISHQLKTPISTLIISNELMLNDKNMKEETRVSFLEKSKNQLERIEWLTKSLLKLAMLESGTITFKNIRTQLVNVVFNAVEFIRNLADEKGIIITVNGDLDKAWFRGDEKWTTEAVVNIVKNSIEHTQDGGKIEILIDQTQILSRIIITDNGEGIAAEDIPKVFDRFYRGKSESKTDSVGVGLALSKMIVDGQNGNISIKSKKGDGSQCMITFLKTI